MIHRSASRRVIVHWLFANCPQRSVACVNRSIALVPESRRSLFLIFFALLFGVLLFPRLRFLFLLRFGGGGFQDWLGGSHDFVCGGEFFIEILRQQSCHFPHAQYLCHGDGRCVSSDFVVLRS